MIFEEKQRFESIWFFLILALVAVYNYILAAYTGETNLTIFYSSFGVAFVIGIIFFVFRLDTKINEQGIFYKFFPVHFSWKFIPWTNIKNISISKYRPLLDYGGWGIRFGFKGRAFTTKGNMGIKIVLKEKNKTLLIGTQKPDEVQLFIQQINRKISNHA